MTQLPGSIKNLNVCVCQENSETKGGWSGGAKVSCILCHQGVQLILAYSWARPAILVAGKGREVIYFFCFFTFIPVPLSRVVGWCKGVVYLALSGRPTDISLQLGKACYPCSR